MIQAISAKVLLWEAGKLGISYRYPNDDRQIQTRTPQLGVAQSVVADPLVTAAVIRSEQARAKQRGRYICHRAIQPNLS